MNTLTKAALGLIGHLRPRPAQGDAQTSIALPAPQTHGGLPLMQALQQRQSQREFSATDMDLQAMSNLLWAATGINRPALGGRTAPSAMNAQEVDVYVALPMGAYLYLPPSHSLRLVVAMDVRRVTGYQDFVDGAPMELVYVADHARMKLVPAEQRTSYACVAAGAMAQNVYLYSASSGLATVIRAWIDRTALAQALELESDHQILLAQTVGWPATTAA